jgi:hypothetical protein
VKDNGDHRTIPSRDTRRRCGGGWVCDIGAPPERL